MWESENMETYSDFLTLRQTEVAEGISSVDRENNVTIPVNPHHKRIPQYYSKLSEQQRITKIKLNTNYCIIILSYIRIRFTLDEIQ